MKFAKHIFLLIPILMIVFHPVFASAETEQTFDFAAASQEYIRQNAGALAIQPDPMPPATTQTTQQNTKKSTPKQTQEQTCKKWQTKNANGQCIDSPDYKKCTKQNANNNSHWDESTNKCVCNDSKYKWDNTLGICQTCNIPHAEEQYYDTTKKKCLVKLGGCEIGYTPNENQTKCVFKKDRFCVPQERDPNASLDGGYELNAQAECVLVKCNPGYKPEKNKCVEENKQNSKNGKECSKLDLKKLSHATAGTYKCTGNSCTCAATKCEDGYKVSGDKCAIDTETNCKDKLPSNSHVLVAHYVDNGKGAVCEITECENGWTPSKDKTFCIASPSSAINNKPETKETTTPKTTVTISGHVTGTASGDESGVISAEITPKNNKYTGIGTTTDTNGDFTLENFPDTEYCVSYMGYESQCVPASTKEVKLTETATDLQELEATADLNCNNETMLKKLNTTKAIKKSSEDGAICEPVKDTCINGYAYVEQDGKAQCVLSDDASDDEETKDPTSTATSSSNTMTEEQKAEIAEKEAKVQELKEKEQSLENRMTTAVSMGGAGIGGMMLAESLSEQSVDAQSEQDMAAYIETFRCEYSGGKSVKGGATEVQLPADTLFDLYQEYIALATDVKTMKEQLDLMPGIESEVLIDKATAGLYDDQSSGKTNGTYASLYRALTDESSEDAQQWSDQKEKTDKNKKIGIGVGVGAAALGGIGNILTNHVDWDKIKEEKNTSKANTDKIKQFKKGLESAGMTNVNKLDLSKFDFTDFDMESINFEDFKGVLKANDTDASKLNTANMSSFMSSLESIGLKIGQ